MPCTLVERRAVPPRCLFPSCAVGIRGLGLERSHRVCDFFDTDYYYVLYAGSIFFVCAGGATARLLLGPSMTHGPYVMSLLFKDS